MTLLSEVRDRLKHLVCPSCKGVLYLETVPVTGLCCPACALVYPIEGFIPILIKHDALNTVVNRSFG